MIESLLRGEGVKFFNREQLASWSGSRDGVLSFAGYLFNNFRDYEWKVLKLHKNMGILYWINSMD